MHCTFQQLPLKQKQFRIKEKLDQERRITKARTARLSQFFSRGKDEETIDAQNETVNSNDFLPFIPFTYADGEIAAEGFVIGLPESNSNSPKVQGQMMGLMRQKRLQKRIIRQAYHLYRKQNNVDIKELTAKSMTPVSRFSKLSSTFHQPSHSKHFNKICMREERMSTLQPSSFIATVRKGCSRKKEMSEFKNKTFFLKANLTLKLQNTFPTVRKSSICAWEQDPQNWM